MKISSFDPGRRQALQLMGAGTLTALAGCHKPNLEVAREVHASNAEPSSSKFEDTLDQILTVFKTDPEYKFLFDEDLVRWEIVDGEQKYIERVSDSLKSIADEIELEIASKGYRFKNPNRMDEVIQRFAEIAISYRSNLVPFVTSSKGEDGINRNLIIIDKSVYSGEQPIHILIGLAKCFSQMQRKANDPRYTGLDHSQQHYCNMVDSKEFIERLKKRYLQEAGPTPNPEIKYYTEKLERVILDLQEAIERWEAKRQYRSKPNWHNLSQSTNDSNIKNLTKILFSTDSTSSSTRLSRMVLGSQVG